MKFAQTISLFFRVVSRMIREDRENRIKFSDRVYMRLPRTEITLVSLGAGESIQTMKLSIDDAREILRSIKRACDLHQVEEIRIDRLSWKTDARVNFPGQDTVVIQFDGPLGFTREQLKREAVTAAVTEFTKRFGLS
jgi:hypothetical protein